MSTSLSDATPVATPRLTPAVADSAGASRAPPTRRRPSHPSQDAQASREEILREAVQIASVKGLVAMSLGSLAQATARSKSGLFSYFRSKEALQLAVVEAAEARFHQEVVVPTEHAPEGFPRVAQLIRRLVAYAVSDLFDGGCFFSAAVHEFDGRPGPVRDRILAFYAALETLLRDGLLVAKHSGHLRAGLDIEQAVFEVQSVCFGLNVRRQLLGNRQEVHEFANQQAQTLLQRLSDAV